MIEQMVHYSKINWIGLLGHAESVADFVLNKEIPVYVKVRRDKNLVYYCYDASTGKHAGEYLTPLKKDAGYIILLRDGWKSGHDAFGWTSGMIFLAGISDKLSIERFSKRIIFLRLDDDSVEEISHSQSVWVSSYSCGGLAIPTIGKVTTAEPRVDEVEESPKENRNPSLNRPALTEVAFRSALIVDRAGWFLAPPPTLENPRLPKDFAIATYVTENDFYFESKDIELLKMLASEHRDLRDYPYKHKEKMPYVYWMFQTMWATKDSESKGNTAAEKWFAEHADIKFRHGTARTALKFKIGLNRDIGGATRGRFTLADIPEDFDEIKYRFDFASEEFSLILYAADWWEDMSGEPILTLAYKLDDYEFAGVEVGDLVYLISRSRLTADDVKAFEARQLKNGKDVRTPIDGERIAQLEGEEKRRAETKKRLPARG